MIKKTVLLFFILTLGGCATFSYTNKELKHPVGRTKASLNVATDRGSHEKALVILSLSGGGSRAAYWAASVMLEMENVYSDDGINILNEVDIISSVSGGSLPAAYYVISKDYDDDTGNVRSNRNWGQETVKDLMARDYRDRWLWNWFWPGNIFKYWFTAFDRSDIMAQTLADNMFDVKTFGYDLSMDDINPERPYLVLNATNGTTEYFSEVFSFTNEKFQEIKSDINDYDISRAVTATASFPAVFNYMTLKNYAKIDGEPAYVHVFDGGNSDNLGLTSVEEIINRNAHNYDKIIVILVDADTKSIGVNRKDYDARNFVDYFVDLNFLDTMNTLLKKNRDALINKLSARLNELNEDKNKTYETIFYHIKFDDIKCEDLRDKLNSIRTDFKIDDAGTEAINKAVRTLIVKKNSCLMKIKDILTERSTNHKVPYCSWPD
ncbi:MAG: patatin-like phospholipase family protein [Nitrospirae bacterium]|nr:patatin-like phospholipase family protein [Nitrospirota bacterium]